MKKWQRLIFIILIVIIAGCAAKSDSQATEVGTLILNQKEIKIIEIFKGTAGQPDITVSDSETISELINKAKEIPVKRLSESEETSFMSKRMMDDSVLILMFYSENESKMLEGQFMIWPDGYICSVDINSMKNDQRTISYYSESKYPELYKWIIDSSQ